VKQWKAETGRLDFSPDSGTWRARKARKKKAFRKRFLGLPKSQ
jgi:hypothetical protein